MRSRSRWVPAPPVPGSFVCNIGDMLDRMTGGAVPLDAAPRPQPGAARPAVVPVLLRPELRRARAADRAAGRRAALRDDPAERWDRASVHAFEGTYGDYLLGKVGKVFPELGERVLG